MKKKELATSITIYQFMTYTINPISAPVNQVVIYFGKAYKSIYSNPREFLIYCSKLKGQFSYYNSKQVEEYFEKFGRSRIEAYTMTSHSTKERLELGEQVLNQAIKDIIQLGDNETGNYRGKVQDFKELNLSYDVSDYHTIHQFGRGDIYVYESDEYYFFLEIFNLA